MSFATYVVATAYPGWWAGLVIGFSIVVVVVIVVAAILTYATRIAEQAREAIDVVDEARQRTLALWELQDTNQAAESVLETARGAGAELGRR